MVCCLVLWWCCGVCSQNCHLSFLQGLWGSSVFLYKLLCVWFLSASELPIQAFSGRRRRSSGSVCLPSTCVHVPVPLGMKPGTCRVWWFINWPNVLWLSRSSAGDSLAPPFYKAMFSDRASSRARAQNGIISPRLVTHDSTAASFPIQSTSSLQNELFLTSFYVNEEYFGVYTMLTRTAITSVLHAAVMAIMTFITHGGGCVSLLVSLSPPLLPLLPRWTLQYVPRCLQSSIVWHCACSDCVCPVGDAVIRNLLSTLLTRLFSRRVN